MLKIVFVLRAGLGTPLLLLVCIAIPLLPILLLAKHRQQLQTEAIQLHLGFIYSSYRSGLHIFITVLAPYATVSMYTIGELSRNLCTPNLLSPAA